MYRINKENKVAVFALSIPFIILIYVAIGDYVYHNDVHFFGNGLIFAETPHLMAVGRPLGGLLIDVMTWAITSETSLRIARVLGVLILAAAVLRAVRTLRLRCGATPGEAVSFGVLLLLMPGSILTAGWAAQLPPTSVALLCAVIGADDILRRLEAVQGPFVDVSPESPMFRRFSGAAERVIDIAGYGASWIFVACLIYPQTALFALSFAAALACFGRRRDPRSLHAAVFLIATTMMVLALTFLLAKLHFGLVFQPMFQERTYSVKFGDVANTAAILAETASVVFSLSTSPASGLLAAAIGSVVLFTASRRFRRAFTERRGPIAVAGFAIICVAAALQVVQIVLFIREPLPTGEYVLHRMTLPIQATLLVVLVAAVSIATAGLMRRMRIALAAVLLLATGSASMALAVEFRSREEFLTTIGRLPPPTGAGRNAAKLKICSQIEANDRLLVRPQRDLRLSNFRILAVYGC